MFNNLEIHSKFKVIWNVTLIIMMGICNFMYEFLYWIKELFFELYVLS